MENRERNRIREKLKNGIGSRETKTFFYWICALSGTILCGMVTTRYILESVLRETNVVVSWYFMFMYLISLVVYVAIKELVTRWFGGERMGRLGEYFVVLWVVVYGLMELSAFFLNLFNLVDHVIVVPKEALVTCLVVFVIFSISYVSKEFFEKNNKKRQKEQLS